MQMSDPAFWNDPEKAKKISQEATLLKTEVEGHEELVRKADDLSDYLEMAMEDGDASFAEDIEKQYHDLLKDIEKREVRLLLSGEYDKCNALITFHAGAGGTEAQDWAQMLIRMYTRWAERNGYKLTILDMQPGDEAGIKSAAFRVEGEYAYGYLKSEKASIAWSAFRLLMLQPGATRPLRLSMSCRNCRMMSMSKSTWTTSASITSAPPVPAASTSIRRVLPSA